MCQSFGVRVAHADTLPAADELADAVNHHAEVQASEDVLEATQRHDASVGSAAAMVAVPLGRSDDVQPQQGWKSLPGSSLLGKARQFGVALARATGLERATGLVAKP